MAAEQSVASPPATVPDGLPDGVVELAVRSWRRAERSAEAAGLEPTAPTGREIEVHVVEELTAPLRLEDWPAPTEPRPVAGGWVHDEVIDDDRPLLEAILSSRGTDGPEAVAEAAQQARLPVTPYRPLPSPDGPSRSTPSPLRPPSPTGPTPASIAAGQDRPVVIDLSTHWAGPLGTSLLAQAGARVIKVDPDCRPDGFRTRPALFHHLNGAKETIDLDLRRDDDRSRFERLLDQADLVVESFSRRVLPNLGYAPADLLRRWPDLALVSIKAFPAHRPEADWLAYGPGVHAASGLGLLDGRARPAPIAYPDLLAALDAFGRAADLLARRRRPDRPTRWIETTLFDAVGPLVERARASARDDAGPDR